MTTIEMSEVKKSERPTIMSGKVITFALDFTQEKGIFGDRDVPSGPFEVSVSRDALIVHHCECTTPEAIFLAEKEMPRLRDRSNGYL